MKNQWVQTYKASEVATKPKPYERMGFGIELEAELQSTDGVVSVDGTMHALIKVPHEAMAQLPQLRDIRVIMRFDKEADAE